LAAVSLAWRRPMPPAPRTTMLEGWRCSIRPKGRTRRSGIETQGRSRFVPVSTRRRSTLDMAPRTPLRSSYRIAASNMWNPRALDRGHTEKA
jgi:hypothetical protein